MTFAAVRIRISVTAVLASLAAGGVAHAQAGPASGPTKGYVEAVAQSAFGNVTSQSFGGELGVTVRPQIQVFAEGGVVRDASPASLGTRAQSVAVGIAAVAGSADFHVKQPVTFGIGGLKYIIPTASRVQPYVLAGGGAARVKRDVTFSTPAGSVTQFATIGTDLSGSETKGMASIGAGVAVPVWNALVVDLQYRYGRVFTSGEGLNINRAGVGVGIRF